MSRNRLSSHDNIRTEQTFRKHKQGFFKSFSHIYLERESIDRYKSLFADHPSLGNKIASYEHYSSFDRKTRPSSLSTIMDSQKNAQEKIEMLNSPSLELHCKETIKELTSQFMENHQLLLKLQMELQASTYQKEKLYKELENIKNSKTRKVEYFPDDSSLLDMNSFLSGSINFSSLMNSVVTSKSIDSFYEGENREAIIEQLLFSIIFTLKL